MLKKFKENSSEYIVITTIFWGLFIIVILASLARFLGWGFYSKEVIQKDYIEWQILIIRFILKFIEFTFIACALTKLKLWQGIIPAVVIFWILEFVPYEIEFFIDILYIFVLPFVFIKFRKDSNKFYYQIGVSVLFFIILSVYQFAMSYGIYEATINENTLNNIAYLIGSIIPYHLFIIWLYLFFRRKDICKTLHNRKRK